MLFKLQTKQIFSMAKSLKWMMLFTCPGFGCPRKQIPWLLCRVDLPRWWGSAGARPSWPPWSTRPSLQKSKLALVAALCNCNRLTLKSWTPYKVFLGAELTTMVNWSQSAVCQIGCIRRGLGALCNRMISLHNHEADLWPLTFILGLKMDNQKAFWNTAYGPLHAPRPLTCHCQGAKWTGCGSGERWWLPKIWNDRLRLKALFYTLYYIHCCIN